MLMHNKNSLLNQLSGLLSRKQSKEFYARRLGITIGQVEDLLQELRNGSAMGEEITKRVNPEAGEIEISGYWDHEPTPEEIIQAHAIDENLWKLSQFWSKQKQNGWQVSALFSQRKKDKEDIKQQFLDFIQEYKPKAPVIRKQTKIVNDENACFVFNKQDFHANKYDVDGNNVIESRFSVVEQKLEKMLKKASAATNIDLGLYIIGSDIFNSEWTGTTVKGTPQQNILPYYDSFDLVCQHEISVISLMLQYVDNLEVVYIPGNHDKYVGWHLVSWLKAYFRDQKNLNIDASMDFTKYVMYNSSAMCFNHGDVMTPTKLAQNFPIEFKDGWSYCNNYYIFTGDKHHELSKDIGGIKYHQLPQLSTSKSEWDKQRGYTTTPAKMTAFLIHSEDGLTDIYQESV